MSGNTELMAAFDNLAKTVNQIQISNSISRAQGKVDAIRNDQKMNEFDKIKAQQALAQSMGVEVLARGGDAAHAEQARLALAPVIPDAAMRQMEATGKDTLAGAQQAIHDRTIKEERDKLKFEADLKLKQLQILSGIKDNKAQGAQLLAYGKDVNPTLARTGNFGKADAMYKATQRAEAIFQQYKQPDGTFDVPKIPRAELSNALAAIVNGGSAQSQAAIDHVTPDSLKGKTNELIGWLTNNPRGTGQQEFMAQLHDSMTREKDTSLLQINDAMDMIDAKHSALFESTNPMIQQRANQLRAVVRGKYPMPGAAQAAPGLPAPAGQAPAAAVTPPADLSSIPGVKMMPKN
jgi:hypothetical protein